VPPISPIIMMARVSGIVGLKRPQHVDKAGAVDGIASDSDARRLPDASPG